MFQLLDTLGENKLNRIIRIFKNIFETSIVEINYNSLLKIENIDKLYIVEDTSKDEYWIRNPIIVKNNYIKFYIEYKLEIDNRTIGSICISDTISKKLSTNEKELIKDLFAMIESELSATYSATIDELTGILNRRGFYNLAEKGIDVCKYAKLPSSLAVIDLNGFKKINDSLGHQAGDQVLKEFSRLLQTSVRKMDMVGRLSGDEFVVWYNGVTKQEANASILRLKTSIKEESIARDAHNINFSVGVVTIKPNTLLNIEEIINAADVLMYKDKLIR